MKLSCILLGAALALATLPAAAQSTYGPANFWGGYKDRQVEPGVWRIRATANPASGGQLAAEAMALHRAAELLRDKGFTHVRILVATGWNLFDPEHGYVPRNFDGATGYATVTVRGASGAGDVEGCRTSVRRNCYTIAVEELMRRTVPHFTRRKSG